MLRAMPQWGPSDGRSHFGHVGLQFNTLIPLTEAMLLHGPCNMNAIFATFAIPEPLHFSTVGDANATRQCVPLAASWSSSWILSRPQLSRPGLDPRILCVHDFFMICL